MGELKNSFNQITELLLLKNPKTYEALKQAFLDAGADEATANRTVKWVHDTIRRALNQGNHNKELLSSLDLNEEEAPSKKADSDLGESDGE